MSIDIQLFSELPEAQKAEVAKLLSAYTNGELGEAPQMLPVSPEDIYNKHIGLVALESGAAVGYVGALAPETWSGKPMSEVGSLMVLPAFRRQGIAHKLVGAISHIMAAVGELPYAFCNPSSIGVFGESGYAEAVAGEVPPSAFSACNKCPMKPPTGCCDKVVIYKEI